MKTEVHILTRISLLQSRQTDNRNIIKKLERQLRKIREAKVN